MAWCIERANGRSERHSEQNEKRATNPINPFPFFFSLLLFSSSFQTLFPFFPRVCCELMRYLQLNQHAHNALDTCTHTTNKTQTITIPFSHPRTSFMFKLSFVHSFITTSSLLEFTRFNYTPCTKQRLFFTYTIQHN